MPHMDKTTMAQIMNLISGKARENFPSITAPSFCTDPATVLFILTFKIQELYEYIESFSYRP